MLPFVGFLWGYDDFADEPFGGETLEMLWRESVASCEWLSCDQSGLGRWLEMVFDLSDNTVGFPMICFIHYKLHLPASRC